jgi:hypothetical protein
MCTKSSFHSFRRFPLSKSTPPWTISSSVDHEMGAGQQLGPLMLPARNQLWIYTVYTVVNSTGKLAPFSQHNRLICSDIHSGPFNTSKPFLFSSQGI